MIESEIFVPFLKWAGGKRWLVKSHPEIFRIKYKRYIEPFLGSGAVFFHISPKKALLSDNNLRLIETYQAIKEDWIKVHKELLVHDKLHNKKYYYDIRERHYRSIYKRAAQFIYLNRTCWNGLFRVNLNGSFNVPIGTKKRAILDTDNFRKTAQLLFKATLEFSDFEESIDKSRRGDLLFVDPPYTVAHNKNGFIKYNEDLFSWDDQERLNESLLSAAKRGVKIISSNAGHNSIIDLYEPNFFVEKVSRSSVIAADSSNRGSFKEVIITRNI